MKHFIALILAVGIALTTSACTAPDKTHSVLESQGYTNIQVTGYRVFSCGGGDTSRTGFIATTLAGKTVSGTVCAGWLKGSTIRLD